MCAHVSAGLTRYPEGSAYGPEYKVGVRFSRRFPLHLLPLRKILGVQEYNSAEDCQETSVGDTSVELTKALPHWLRNK